MPPKPQPDRKPSSAPPDSLPPRSDALPGDLRREDQKTVPPDSLPNPDEEARGDDTVGAHSLAPDGGNADHPIHDDDPSEDFTARDYEEQIDEVADAGRDKAKRATANER